MKNKKIALIGFRLNKGGAERVMANLSLYFDKQGIDVHHIIILDDIGYKYAGTVFNLGKLKNKTNGFFNKLKRLKALKVYLKQNKFDYIIDFRFRIKPLQDFLIAHYIYNTKTIFTIHSSKIDEYIPKSRWLANALYKSCYAVVSINQAMEALVKENYKFDNSCLIYNPVDANFICSKKEEAISFKNDFIIGVGEFENNIKQFDVLIEAYSKSELPNNNIALIILGEGKQREYLLKLAKKLKVDHLVHLLGFKENPFKYLSKAKFLALTSKFEGFPMVLLEALTCGIPVVAFDCPTGPREIIQDRYNGLLIENQKLEQLIIGMNEMLLNKELYKTCRLNAANSIEKFSLDVIGHQWMKLMQLK